MVSVNMSLILIMRTFTCGVPITRRISDGLFDHLMVGLELVIDIAGLDWRKAAIELCLKLLNARERPEGKLARNVPRRSKREQGAGKDSKENAANVIR